MALLARAELESASVPQWGLVIMLALGGSDNSHVQTRGHRQLEPGSTQHMCRRPLHVNKAIVALTAERYRYDGTKSRDDRMHCDVAVTARKLLY